MLKKAPAQSARLSLGEEGKEIKTQRILLGTAGHKSCVSMEWKGMRWQRHNDKKNYTIQHRPCMYCARNRPETHILCANISDAKLNHQRKWVRANCLAWE